MGLIDTSGWAFGVERQVKAPKPDAWRQSRMPYAEKKVLDATRRRVFRRDGGCKAADLGGCLGRQTLAHMEGKRKHQTVHKPPEERHDPKWCADLCLAHHRQEEAHQIRPVYQSKRLQCNGPFHFVRAVA